MATRSANTMSEGLQKILADISALKIAPDADIPFLINLETAVASKLREPFDKAAGQMEGAGMPGPPSDPSMAGGGPPVPNGGSPIDMSQLPPPQQGPGAVPGGINGMRTTPAMPNPDELRRVLGQ